MLSRWLSDFQIALITLIVAPWMVGNADRANADDIDTVRQRVVDDLLKSIPSTSTISGYRSSLNSNGSWSDINYNSTSSVDWTPLTHLERLEAMAESYSKSSSSLYHDAGLKADILKSYNYWISKDPQSSNWYYNEISSTQKLGEAMVLISDILSSSQRSSGLNILQRAYEPRSYNSGTNTGQNRVERATAGIYRGLVADSTSITDDAFAAIGDALATTTGDGFQRDGSFHQHGNQIYNAGYGLAFVASTAATFSWNTGTGFSYSTAQKQTYVDGLLDGTQWMLRGQQFDYTVGGRYVTRKGYSDNAAPLAGQLNTLLDANLDYRTAELTQFQSRIAAANSSGSASSSLALVGNRQFWNSDLIVHQRSAYYASVKTSSVRTIQPETGNDEGKQSLYLGDGVNLIMRTGNEYDNIAPFWNWRRLPGTTVEQDTRSLKPTAEFGVAGTAVFAGGASDRQYGTTGFNYSRFNVQAHKSWFFFDDEFVALGSAINAPNANSNVNTTINQSLLKGTVSYKTTSSNSVQTLALGNQVSPSGLKWVYHDGIGYFFTAPVDNVEIRALTRTGSWDAINSRYDDTAVSGNVFLLFVNHGQEFTGGTYSYIVVPGLSLNQADSYLADNPIEVLRNTSSVQAVRQTTLGMVQATFYSAASLSLGGGQSFAVSDPSSLIFQRPTNAIKFTAASPVAASPLLAIDLSNIPFNATSTSWLDGFTKSATLELGLSTGTRAGDSVGIAITTDGATKPVIQFTTYDQPTTFKYTSDSALVLPNDTRINAGSNKTLTFNGVISGNASLTKSGASDLFLNGKNTYTGGTVIVDGTATISGDQRSANGGWSIGPDSESPVTVTFKSGSQVQVAAGNEFRVGADTARGSEKQTVYFDGTMNNAGSLAVNRYGWLKVTGAWTQSGPMEIFGKGSDNYSPIVTVSDSGTFTYSGTSTIKINPSVSSSADATLFIGGTDGSGTFTTGRGFERTVATGDGTSSITLRNGGTLKLSADVAQLTTGSIKFRLGDGGGIINTNGFDTALGAGLSNESGTSGGLTKLGAGTLELRAAGTYTGTTTISAGSLIVSNSSGSATGTGSLTLAASATLGGAGFIVPGSGKSISLAGRVTPGNNIGTFTLGSATTSSAVTTAATTVYTFELANAGVGGRIPALGSSSLPQGHANHDVLRIFGTLNFNANAVVNIVSLGDTLLDPSNSYSWLIATADDGITGTPKIGTISGTDFTIYKSLPGHSFSLLTAGDNLYLQATAPVPEPSHILLIVCAAASIAALRRRMRMRLAD